MFGGFSYGGPPGMSPGGSAEDAHTHDVARQLSFSGAASSEDVIASLRSMNLGDNFWMYSFKVPACLRLVLVVGKKWAAFCSITHSRLLAAGGGEARCILTKGIGMADSNTRGHAAAGTHRRCIFSSPDLSSFLKRLRTLCCCAGGAMR